MRTMVIIQNHQKHVVHFVSALKKVEARLAPGLNEIPLDTWKALLTEQNVQDRFDDGWVTVEEETSAEVDVSFYLNENAARARTIARNNKFEKDVLQEWFSKEQRKGIKEILKKRLQEFKE